MIVAAYSIFCRILIVDWDVHHGQGIQDIFYKDDRFGYLFLIGKGVSMLYMLYVIYVVV